MTNGKFANLNIIQHRRRRTPEVDIPVSSNFVKLVAVCYAYGSRISLTAVSRYSVDILCAYKELCRIVHTVFPVSLKPHMAIYARTRVPPTVWLQRVIYTHLYNILPLDKIGGYINIEWSIAVGMGSNKLIVEVHLASLIHTLKVQFYGLILHP